MSAAETRVIFGDFNDHVGKLSNGYEGIYGGHDYDLRNTEGERTLELAVGHNLIVGNSHFNNNKYYLVTYQSSDNSNQKDYILNKKSSFK